MLVCLSFRHTLAPGLACCSTAELSEALLVKPFIFFSKLVPVATPLHFPVEAHWELSGAETQTLLYSFKVVCVILYCGKILPRIPA